MSEPASDDAHIHNRPGTALLKVGRLSGTLALGALMTLALGQTAQAQLPPPTAADIASHPVYAPTWDTGDNGGFGMGPWTLNPATNTPQNGFFVGDSTGNNGMSGDSNGDGDINTPVNRAWGLYANSSQTAGAVRNFLAPFTPGSVFEIFMDNGDVQTGGTVGFALRNGAGQELLEVYFIGGDTQYTVHGSTPISSGINFTREGVRVVITLTTASTYQATLTRLVDGASNTVSGTLRANPGPISQLRLFNANAGAGGGNDLFFNRITHYQGRVLNVDTGRGYLDIQPAINDPATLAGHTISVSAGLYTGTQNNNIVINKPRLTLVGAGPTATVISRTASGTLKGIEIAPFITGTTVSSLRVQGFNDGGVCAMQDNHFTTITNTHVYSNTDGGNCLGGIYMNGPVNHVLISHNEAVNNTSRGIVIWNGFKTNITITHNLARNNNCCGIELQDGTASGVLIAHNTVRDNFDNGIGTVGLTAGAGPNLIYSNTLINNGRFGIEVKLPSGSGLPSGDGSIVVLSNTVALTDTIANVKPGEQRDLAGIAAFRRGWLAGNADIPAGVIVQGNVVSGYQQPSASDGFGIVVEGARMTVVSNTLENNDVGVQVQAGHTPYAPFTNVNGNDSNLPDQYFGRGNSPVACAFYQAGNVFTGNLTNTRQVGPVTPGTVTNLNTGQTFCGIQQAIDAPPTLNGHVISVSAGIYTELVSVTKQLTLLGAQHGQDAVARTAAFVGGKANPTLESIIYTPINNPTGGNPGAADLFRVLTHNVTIDGFVFDGNNPALLTSTVQIEGVYAHARRGVTNIGPNDSFNPLNNLVLRNNVFQNFARHGIWLENNGPVSTGNLIEQNVLRRIPDRAIFLITNAYADIVSNTITVPVSVSLIGFGINMLNFYANGSMAWLSNTITIVTNAMGMHANLFYAPSATLFIRGNVVNADAASAVPSLAVWGWGINVWSVQQGSTVIVEGNRVGLSGGRLGRGINVWNVPTSNTVRVISNAVANSTVGVHLDNINPYGGGGGASSALLVTTNAITGTTDGIGLLVRVASPNVAGHGLMLISDTTVVSAGVGLRVETGITSTFMASATLHNSTLRNNGIGIQVLRGALTATHNYLLTNTLGVTNTGGASVDVWLNRNAIVGNGAGITNTAAGTLNAECNWYGAVSGPAGAGSGGGDSVSTGVDFNPWLLSDALNDPCSGGSLTIQKVLVGPITPTTAWQFTATVPTGTLVFTLPAGGGAVTFGGLDFGQVTITETAKLGYSATSSCTTGATGGASISFGLIGDATCTFTNTIAPATAVVTVTPVITNGWFYITETIGTSTGLLPFDIVLPPPAPTLGAASARLVITDVNWRHMYLAPVFTGTLLSDVTVFEYRLRIPSASPQTPYINIGWDDNVADSNTGFRGRLVYSPSSLPADTWHIVDARNDPTPRWYTTLAGATQCTSSTPCTFEQLVAAYPNAAIHPNSLMGVPLGFIGIRVGGGSSTGTGYADGLRVGVGSQITLFDFEAASPTTVTLTANPTTTVVGSNVLLTATVTISNGDPAADGTVVSFTTSLGNVSPVTATTSGGVVTATLNSTVAGVATVTATVDSLSATALVTFTPGAPFTLTLAAVPNTLSVDDTSTLTATAADQYGNAVADGTTISFTTSLGTLSSGAANTSGGNATVSLNSTTPGVATVTATVGSLNATALVTFTPGAPFTLTLIAVPNTLPVGNSSALTATATDQYGNAVANGTTISFTTSFGTLSSGTANTVGGSASVALSSTVSGVATVTATVGSLNATALVTFTPGAPYTYTFTLAPTLIYANGISQSVGTVTVVDQYGNPVGGVTVNFLAGIGSFSPASGATNAGGQITAVLTSLTPAIENVFAVVSGLGFSAAQVTYVNLPASSAPLTSTLQTVTQTLGVVRKGDLITYTLVVTNTGAGQINNVLIYAPIPSGTTYVAGSASGGNYSGSFAMLLSGQELGASQIGPQAVLNAVSWSGNLPGGASHTLSYVVQTQILEGQIVNQPKVFVDNADTGINLSSAVEVVANKVFLPIAQR